MIDLLQGLLMALFQGIIEWLPISSEGQLSLLFVNIYGMAELEAVTLALLLHLGTMVSVLLRFPKDFVTVADLRTHISHLVIIATFGTAITAVPILLLFKNFWEFFRDLIPIEPGNFFTLAIGFFLIITGFILAKRPDQGERTAQMISKKEALLLGMVQGVATLPGISRSGITISMLLYIGLRQQDAFRISFIISVPAALGATVLEFLLSGFTFDYGSIIVGTTEIPLLILFVSLIVTAVIGFLTINALLSLKDIKWENFCLGFGSFTVAVAVLFIWFDIIYYVVTVVIPLLF